ncbi:hypothetical protein HPB47_012967 [Ixodes persulcatus]|uniref:Uncharacterized protein n=1 Tax=Ixodes persulcatus TaxID=34615 RepID=A0AC60NS16_IXOPE|nr:hypothetical protein HPB47_012967 [Ixodes persulcatus]
MTSVLVPRPERLHCLPSGQGANQLEADLVAREVRALCDMSMEQQVRDYLSHCPVPGPPSVGPGGPQDGQGPGPGSLGPPGPHPPPQGPPPPPPGCALGAGRILSRNANGTSVLE